MSTEFDYEGGIMLCKCFYCVLTYDSSILILFLLQTDHQLQGAGVVVEGEEVEGPEPHKVSFLRNFSFYNHL